MRWPGAVHRHPTDHGHLHKHSLADQRIARLQAAPSVRHQRQRLRWRWAVRLSKVAVSRCRSIPLVPVRDYQMYGLHVSRTHRAVSTRICRNLPVRFQIGDRKWPETADARHPPRVASGGQQFVTGEPQEIARAGNHVHTGRSQHAHRLGQYAFILRCDDQGRIAIAGRCNPLTPCCFRGVIANDLCVVQFRFESRIQGDHDVGKSAPGRQRSHAASPHPLAANLAGLDRLADVRNRHRRRIRRRTYA